MWYGEGVREEREGEGKEIECRDRLWNEGKISEDRLK